MMDFVVEILVIALPTLVAVASIIGIVCLLREEVRTWVTGLFRKKDIDYNAATLAAYEPVRRWSDSTFTSFPLQSNETTSNMPIPPPVALDAVLLTSPNSCADIATMVPTSWQARPQERTRLNDTSLRPKLSQQTRNPSRPGQPTLIHNSSRRSAGPGNVQASLPHGGRPRSRASSISETELRDLQAAFAFVEEQEQEENKIRVCRSLELISRNAGTKLAAGAAGR
ncbi:hypothetical protein CLAFUW4_04372 [Fulvia fulva]|uniref:Uncharacterized protein n=1 Tax=Passalora fulva TaxID=5499 RepID=A0A9Q8P8G8_PASFU|nr:uncharacterized protein CLAFUR5_04335 [Fulvia fulva]KAK4626066.1 hypothetical protein CLAFUR4_04358 [Fulvia fulva]KAK4627948.1 hypothetical protein CLAFUR0_04359 [Fulvia fulva]UJO17128.1 hypothetical protein CLAFUR5_04335 [Fulvia fulva]WPV14276.1 hypothetical protein CLAFUW4_04372 [Fulvia fulva]WPV29124.1 hypothetical protein CLAFUW7_04361 [Fulvia fulva]